MECQYVTFINSFRSKAARSAAVHIAAADGVQSRQRE
jgi:hypothetical protein